MRGIGEPELQVAPKIGLFNVRRHAGVNLALWPLGVKLGPAIADRRLSHGETVRFRLTTGRPAPGELRKIDEFHNLNLCNRMKAASSRPRAELNKWGNSA